MEIAQRDWEYPRAIAWMEAKAPPGAPVICMQVSGAMVAYSERPIIRYDKAARSEFNRLVEVLLAKGLWPYALLFEFEVERFLDRSSIQWKRVGELGRASLLRPLP